MRAPWVAPFVRISNLQLKDDMTKYLENEVSLNKVKLVELLKSTYKKNKRKSKKVYP